MNQEKLVEVAAGSVRSCLEAQHGGAGRVELCSALSTGGLTPSLAQVQLARSYLHIPLFVLVRPRDGDFVYDSLELEIMEREIMELRRLGVDGVVTGALLPDGTLNEQALSRFAELAHPLPLTLHRAFDLTPDLEESLEKAIRCGCRRILTSGGKLYAREGAGVIHHLNRLANGRIGLIPGGRLAAGDLPLVYDPGLFEFHLSGRVRQNSPLQSELYEMEYDETDHAVVRDFTEKLRLLSVPDAMG